MQARTGPESGESRCNPGFRCAASGLRVCHPGNILWTDDGPHFVDMDDCRMAPAVIESLRTLRIIHYAAWLARRWKDPAFPRNFPWFGTNAYWDEHLNNLREQRWSGSRCRCIEGDPIYTKDAERSDSKSGIT